MRTPPVVTRGRSDVVGMTPTKTIGVEQGGTTPKAGAANGALPVVLVRAPPPHKGSYPKMRQLFTNSDNTHSQVTAGGVA
jgi:hypothetical protein